MRFVAIVVGELGLLFERCKKSQQLAAVVVAVQQCFLLMSILDS